MAFLAGFGLGALVSIIFIGVFLWNEGFEIQKGYKFRGYKYRPYYTNYSNYVTYRKEEKGETDESENESED